MSDVAATARQADEVPSIWTFIVADAASFGIFFVVFMVERAAQPASFARSARLLDTGSGLVNTVLLIVSSWLVALAVAAARRGDARRVMWLLSGAIAAGAGFVGIKIAEYADKIQAGIGPLADDFFGYYFVLTGLHLLHVLVGLGALTTLLMAVRRKPAIERGYQYWLESGGIYWHLVDLLWMFLFPMLYLQAAR